MHVYAAGCCIRPQVFRELLMTPPKDINIVPFVSVDAMMRIVLNIGIERVLQEIARYIEEDFRHWENFEKTPRLASHSYDGVIELMSTTDGLEYGFKYVNGHPRIPDMDCRPWRSLAC